MSMIGKTMAHYEIISKLGEGGMGVVYLAHDTSLDRKVAIKFLPESLKQDETARKRFVREARSAAALDHPYICSIHEVGEAEGKSFIVMEYLEGQTLKDRLAQGAVPLKEAMQWVLEIAEALAVAHEKGIIHRDLKPANIMLLRTGHAKVMDFGLAKQVAVLPGSGDQEHTLTAGLTREGTTVGTVPYMSPEQVQGKTVDLRSDLFSFGIVIYELLTGVNPFKRDSGFDTAEAILKETPVPISKYRDEAPQPLVTLINKLLAKDPKDRYQQAREVADNLQKAIDETSGQQVVITRAAFAKVRKALKKPVYLIPLILVMAAAAYLSVQGVKTYQKAKWAREVAPKEVERLMKQGRPVVAARLLKEAERYALESRELDRLKAGLIGSSVTIQTIPPGADIYVRDYADIEDNDLSHWELLGRSPFSTQELPSGYHRFRVIKEGFEAVEVAGTRAFEPIPLRLHSHDATPAGMVWVSGTPNRGANPAVAPGEDVGFWIDKYEVTNRQFKEFVDAGGYQKREYWEQPFIRDGKQLSWDDAMAAFRDASGRPGPATWEFGNYPEGRADFPVGGVSWYEAAAYSTFAGKSLPTVYHWSYAAFEGISTDSVVSLFLIARLSNFSAKGPAPIRTYHGLGDFGTYDMAGNLKEWCSNEVGNSRYLLGGAWNDPDYMSYSREVRQSFDRAATFGFRCVKYTAPTLKALTEPMPIPALSPNDRRNDKPVNDQAFRIYLDLHSYVKTDLKQAVASVDESSSPYWRKEKITFEAAYGNERVIADLYLPKNASPPYQIALYFPSADAAFEKALPETSFRPVEFVLRSGRAVIVPHYKYMLERGPAPNVRGRPDLTREIYLQWSKDLERSIDYLETRSEIDIGKLAFFGLSLGAREGPRLIAVEPRIKVAVLMLGSSSGKGTPAEVDNWNFASRVRIPVLMLNGRNEPVGMAIFPLFRLLGTPEKDKLLLFYEGGHDIFDRLDVYKDVMNWLDRCLGPVKMKPNR